MLFSAAIGNVSRTPFHKNRMSWMIGGPQGSGINVSAEVFAKACVRFGLRVFSNIEYHSNIMGRHSFFRVRVSENPIFSHVEPVDLLLALDRETIFGDVDAPYRTHNGHLHRISPGGGLIVDSALGIDPEEFGRDDIHLFSLPYEQVLREGVARAGVEFSARRHDIMRNMVSVAASFALIGLDPKSIVDILRERLGEHRAQLVELNAAVLDVTRDYMQSLLEEPFGPSLAPVANNAGAHRALVRGAEAVALGKLHAGCTFQSYYPIAPATEESVFLEKVQTEFPIIVLQAEDEIACINQAVGAAYGGARAATSTAGPGFSLMSEGIGLAAITETPGPVICLYQRGGPSTGLPTRGGQTDLRLALQPGHGEFPHIVVAPGDLQECFDLTFEAFNWGDEYQLPVVVLLDRHLSNSNWTVDGLRTDHLKVRAGPRYVPNGQKGPFERHQITESGVSARSVPGEPGGMFVTTSDEHTTYGKISESMENRMQQMEKRMRKLDTISSQVPDELKFTLHGPADAEYTVVAWGSTKGAILDALGSLGRRGITVNYLQLRMLRPFPTAAVADILSRARNLILIEDNFNGQLGQLIAELTGVIIERRVLKYDGRPFSQTEIESGIEQQIAGCSPRLVLSHP